MSRPRILDLFCGAGGATRGYMDAGFLVVGVDVKPQPRYCGHAFYEADALEFAAKYGHLFDAIHASPPCQSSTTASNRWRGKGGLADSHPNLIPGTQTALYDTGLPYVIENVPGARRWLLNPFTIRGGAFGLGVCRPRLFETNFPVPRVPNVRAREPVGVYGALDGRRLTQNARKDGSHQFAPKTIEEARRAMGIDWMEWDELKESIPPAYTRHVGNALRRHLDSMRAVGAVPFPPEHGCKVGTVRTLKSRAIRRGDLPPSAR